MRKRRANKTQESYKKEIIKIRAEKINKTKSCFFEKDHQKLVDI